MRKPQEFTLEVLDGERRAIGADTVEAHKVGSTPVLRVRPGLTTEEFQIVADELARCLSDMGEEAIIIPGEVQIARLVPVRRAPWWRRLLRRWLP